MSKKKSIKITYPMVYRGVKALREANALDYESGADFLLVREILEKALSCPPVKKKDSTKKLGAQ